MPRPATPAWVLGSLAFQASPQMLNGRNESVRPTRTSPTSAFAELTGRPPRLWAHQRSTLPCREEAVTGTWIPTTFERRGGVGVWPQQACWGHTPTPPRPRASLTRYWPQTEATQGHRRPVDAGPALAGPASTKGRSRRTFSAGKSHARSAPGRSAVRSRLPTTGVSAGPAANLTVPGPIRRLRPSIVYMAGGNHGSGLSPRTAAPTPARRAVAGRSAPGADGHRAPELPDASRTSLCMHSYRPRHSMVRFVCGWLL